MNLFHLQFNDTFSISDNIVSNYFMTKVLVERSHPWCLSVSNLAYDATFMTFINAIRTLDISPALQQIVFLSQMGGI